MRRDRNGIPILGAVDPMEVRVAEVIAEKYALTEPDHDWQVIVAYAISNDEAKRAHEDDSGHAQVPLMEETVAGIVGPVCAKCKMVYAVASTGPCGTIDHVGAQIVNLTPEQRRDLIERLSDAPVADLVERLSESEPDPMHTEDYYNGDDQVSATDGYDYTLDDGTVVSQPPIPGV